ncbi:MAG: hypothetical protein ACLQVI_33520 [Polyangiaceae bacterium]
MIAIDVSATALVVNAIDSKHASLFRAQGLAINALEALGETPIAGVGINVRYKVGDIPANTVKLMKTELDQGLVDKGLVVKSKAIHWTLTFGAGVLNLALSEDEAGQGTVVFNFHLGTNEVGAAKEWLGLPEAKAKTVVDSLLRDCIGVM